MGGDLELDCARVKTFDHLAEWAIASFSFPATVGSFPRVKIAGLLFAREVIDMDRFTSDLYHHIGKNGHSYSVRLLNYQSATEDVLSVLNHEKGWRRSFGAGLPHDYGVGVGFEP